MFFYMTGGRDSTLVVDAHDDLRTFGPFAGRFEARRQTAGHDVVSDRMGLQHGRIHLSRWDSMGGLGSESNQPFRRWLSR